MFDLNVILRDTLLGVGVFIASLATCIAGCKTVDSTKLRDDLQSINEWASEAQLNGTIMVEWSEVAGEWYTGVRAKGPKFSAYGNVDYRRFVPPETVVTGLSTVPAVPLGPVDEQPN
jgi:hypothetical protein